MYLCLLSLLYITQKVAVTGTIYNPRRFARRFEVLDSLLSLFDLQERVENQMQSHALTQPSEGSGMPQPLLDNPPLADMQTLLEKVIQDSCDYVSKINNTKVAIVLAELYSNNCFVGFLCGYCQSCVTIQIEWILADFFIPFDCGDFYLTQLPFNCSREAVKLLRLELEAWMLNRDLYSSIESICHERKNCPQLITRRSTWVSGLNLNTSDATEAQIKGYLDCII